MEESEDDLTGMIEITHYAELLFPLLQEWLNPETDFVILSVLPTVSLASPSHISSPVGIQMSSQHKN